PSTPTPLMAGTPPFPPGGAAAAPAAPTPPPPARRAVGGRAPPPPPASATPKHSNPGGTQPPPPPGARPRGPGPAYGRGAPSAPVPTFCASPATPVVYDYGANLVYEDNAVFHNGEPVATAAEYAAQAMDFAAAGQVAKPAETDEWQSLGVFAMV